MIIYTPVVEDPVFEAKVALILLCVPLEKSQVNCDFNGAFLEISIITTSIIEVLHCFLS